jgi:hypothetical protein
MTESGAPITPASAANGEDARHIVAERFDGARVRERGAHHEPRLRHTQHRVQRRKHDERERHHERAIAREGRAVKREKRTVEYSRHARAERAQAPAELDEFAEHVGRAEGQQQLGEMSVTSHAAQQPALERRADQADDERRDHERGPETEARRHRIADVSAQHVEARVREVEHAEHAEDQRQARRQHEEQQAEADSVQQIDDERLHA